MVFARLQRWFQKPAVSLSVPSRRTELKLEALESRNLLSLFHVPHIVLPKLELPTVLNYCKTHLGTRVGSGECANLATEALHFAGARYLTDPDPSLDPDSNTLLGPGDYVWGRLDAVFGENARTIHPVQVGDILQFHDASFPGGEATQHTAIVAAVSGGLPTKVYEQNIANPDGTYDRRVRLDDINLSQVTSGWVRAYHAVPQKVTYPAVITVVNNLSRPVSVMVDRTRLDLAPADTTGSELFLEFAHRGHKHTISVVGMGVSDSFSDDTIVQIKQSTMRLLRYVAKVTDILPITYATKFKAGSDPNDTPGLTLVGPHVNTANLMVTNAFLTHYPTADGPLGETFSGEQVSVEVQYQTVDLPPGTSYVISQTVNSVTLTDTVTFGVGQPGVGNWYHIWGPFTLGNGANQVSVTLDATNNIPETSETDNSTSFVFYAA